MKQRSKGHLRLAVVGHTNTGKTSLVRTLTHNRDFGQVRDQGGTTRQVEPAQLVAEDGTRIELFDTPGLENAPELIEWLDSRPGQRHDGPERVEGFLRQSQAVQRFAQEASVLALMLDVDAALYVIDAREPVLEKYQDELAILQWCARPMLAVLNFTAAPDSRREQWQQALARVGLHTVQAFDVAVRDPATELRLFEKLKSLLDKHARALDAWMAHRKAEEDRRRHAGLAAVADLLLDAAACALEARRDDQAGQKRVRRQLQDMIRERKQMCAATLLELYRFGQEKVDDDGLPLSDGRWRTDPFDPETLRHYGLRASGCAAAGAGAGAVVDVASGGLTLGTGTLVGAIAGAAGGLFQGGGPRLHSRLRGRVLVQVDDAVIRLLMARALHLLQALVQRGHGSRSPLQIGAAGSARRTRLPRTLRRARHHPDWSTLTPGHPAFSRQRALDDLTGELDDEWQEKHPQ